MPPQVLKGLKDDETLTQFRDAYVKLHDALKRSHEHEHRLVKKVKDLNSEIVSNAGRVQQALEFSKDDEVQIDSLKQQIKRVWAIVERSREKEAKATETIQKLKSEIAKLTSIAQQGAGMLSQVCYCAELE